MHIPILGGIPSKLENMIVTKSYLADPVNEL